MHHLVSLQHPTLLSYEVSAISLLEKLRPKEHAILHQGHEVSGKVSGSETQSWLTPVPKLLFTILGIRVQFDFRAERGVFTLYHFIYFRHPRRLILPKGTQRDGSNIHLQFLISSYNFWFSGCEGSILHLAAETWNVPIRIYLDGFFYFSVFVSGQNTHVPGKII